MGISRKEFEKQMEITYEKKSLKKLMDEESPLLKFNAIEEFKKMAAIDYKKIVLDIEKIGLHLVSDRGLYTHHGIYIGDGNVIHYSGLVDGIESGSIEIVSLEKFHMGKGCFVKKHKNIKYTGEEIVERAKTRLGENTYSVTGNNCEHFVNWAIYGNHYSEQVENKIPLLTGAEILATGGGATAMVSTAGTVAGLSGSGIMSGLGAVGIGGAVGGVGTLAGGAGLGAALVLNNTLLKDDKSLDDDERKSRALGRKATIAGAGATTIGGIATISTAGITSGLSATGISSGLAAIGGTVGGGMAAGVAVVASAPVVAAAGIGYGVYKLAKEESLRIKDHELFEKKKKKIDKDFNDSYNSILKMKNEKSK